MLLLYRLPRKVHTITADNGKEFCRHKTITAALNADTHTSATRTTHGKRSGGKHQRPDTAVFTEGASFRKVSDKAIRAVETAPNRRSRKALDYETPEMLFFSKFTPLSS